MYPRDCVINNRDTAVDGFPFRLCNALIRNQAHYLNSIPRGKLLRGRQRSAFSKVQSKDQAGVNDTNKNNADFRNITIDTRQNHTYR
jgi:hypothetical protein